MSNQLELLIVNSLKILGESFPPCIVVIDALDECKDSGTISEILAVLALYVRDISQIYFFFTSRPEETSHFKSNTLETETREFILHEVQLDVVQNDIETYITNHGRRTKTFKPYPVLRLAFLTSLRPASNSLKIETVTIPGTS